MKLQTKQFSENQRVSESRTGTFAFKEKKVACILGYFNLQNMKYLLSFCLLQKKKKNHCKISQAPSQFESLYNKKYHVVDFIGNKF